MRIVFLENIRAIAIIMVVGVHSLGYCVKLSPIQENIVLFVIATVSVPCFFLVDGYLFSCKIAHGKDHDYFGYIWKSINRLILPWAIFTTFYTLLRYVFELSGFLNEKLIIGRHFDQVLESAYGSVYAPQMYFLFSLFLIRLCSPIFRRVCLIKNFKILILLYAAYYIVYKYFISFAGSYLNIKGGQEPVLHALWGLQFYFLGIVIYKFREISDIKKIFLPFAAFFLLLTINRFKIGIEDMQSLLQYFYLITLFLFFALFQSKVTFLTKIGKNTMGVYLIHAPIVLKGVSLTLNQVVVDPMLSFILVLLGTFCLSLCIVLFINSVPYGCLLFGTPYKK